MPKLHKRKPTIFSPRPRYSCPANEQRCPPMSADVSRSLMSRLFPVARPYFKRPVCKGDVLSTLLAMFNYCYFKSQVQTGDDFMVIWAPQNDRYFPTYLCSVRFVTFEFSRESFQNLNWRVRRVPQCLDLKRPKASAVLRRDFATKSS